MVESFIRKLTALVFAVLFLGVAASAQTARLSGVVTDPQGASIPAATVQIVHLPDQVKQQVVSDASGAYSVPNLAAGDYQILVTSTGFSPSTAQTVHLAEGQALVLNIQLSVESTNTEVTVSTGGAASITLDNATLSGTISEKEVTSYGLNGRNFSQLVALTPGVSNQSGQDEAKVGVAGSAKFSVNGGRVEYNTFEVDGSDVLNTSINASRGQGLPLMVYPSVDAIQEMQVLTSNYGAQYGKSASGSVLVTTKSGSAAIHGNAYAFLRNEVFNARNYFDQPGRTPLYRRQDYGGTIGGPLFIPHLYNTKKDKTFFFFSEELRLEKTPVDYNQAVPTLAERSGDFTDVCPGLSPTVAEIAVTSKTPDCPITDYSLGYPASMGHVNVNYLAGAILNTNLIPLPNSQVGCNTTNETSFNRCYDAAVSPPTYWREELFRIDHNITPTELLSFRYVHDSWNTVVLTPQWGVVQNSFPTVENKIVGPGLDLVLSLAQTLPHETLNRIGLSYVVQHISLATETGPGVTSLARPTILDDASPEVTGGTAAAGSNLCSVVTGPQPTPPGEGTAQQLTECPLGHIFSNGYGGKMPGLDFQGNNGAYGGHGFAADTGYAPWSQANPTYNLRDDVNKVFGKHSLQAGFEATYTQQNQQSSVSGANSGDLQGLLTFSNQQSKNTSGNAFADFIAGPGIFRLVSSGAGNQPATEDFTGTAIKSFTQDSGQGRYYNRYKALEFYLQDDWRISARLTVNLGFRGSLFGAWYNPYGTAYNWEPQAYDKSLGASIYVDPNFGELVRSSGPGGTGLGSLPTVPLNLGHLDPAITNGLVQCGRNGVPSSCMTNHLFNPAPRVGFAFDPEGNGRSSIRAGYGLFWEHGIGNEANTGALVGSAPLILSETQTFPSPVNIGVAGAGNGSSSLAGAYNSIGLVCTANCGLTNGASVSAGTFPLNVTSIPTKEHYSYTQQWSLSIQRELRKDIVGTVAYVGTKGTHLTAIRNLNQLQPLPSALNPFPAGQPLTADICGAGAQSGVFPVSGTFAGTGVTSSPGIGPNQPGYENAFVACTGSPGFKSGNNVLGVSPDTLRQYTGFSNIISLENTAVSNYHALQATVRRTHGDLTLGATYTWSHGLDDASDRSSNNFADSLTLKSNYSSSDFDQRQLINFSYIYELPLLRILSNFTHFLDDKALDPAPGAKPSRPSDVQDSHLLKTLLANWEISGITIYQTGTPFSVVNAGGSNGIAPADNAGVGNNLGIGSYADKSPLARSTRPTVTSGASNIGPLLGNPLEFQAPRGLTFGNSGRNFLNNPSRTNFNVSLLKSFKVLHDRNLEFRTEAFNVFNHTQFRVYDPSHPGNTGNNVINCYGDITTGYSAGSPGCLAGNSFLHPVDAHDPRILQFGLKLAF
jgi:hypothetical protein